MGTEIFPHDQNKSLFGHHDVIKLIPNMGTEICFHLATPLILRLPYVIKLIPNMGTEISWVDALNASKLSMSY